MERRDALTTAGALLAAATAQPTAAQAAPKRPIVLVHGAGHGGWCWRDVRRRLQSQGFDVFTPTLTGLGDRKHLRSPDIGLYTHITDIVNLIEFEELKNVVLVGHSYAGMVVTGVCDALRNRIAQLIIIDGAVPQDGDPSFPGTTREMLRERFGGFKDDYMITMNVAGLGFPDPNDPIGKWLTSNLTEHLVKTWTDTISLKNGGSDGIPRTFVQCADLTKLAPAGQARITRLKADPTWSVVEKIGPHNVMNSDPVWTANLIAEKAT